MLLAACAIVFALTRAELIDRLQAPPLTKVDGLVKVYADCPADMRRDFQAPVANFAADICRGLYSCSGMREMQFRSPGIIIHIGDVRTNDTTVVARRTSDGTSRVTRITLPSPEHCDIERFRLETARAFFYAVTGETPDDAETEKRLDSLDPERRAARKYGELDKWERGECGSGDDEEYLKLARTVIFPGRAAPRDVLRFASRLRLYPATFAVPFAGKRFECTFEEAVEMAEADPAVRFAAYAKSAETVIFGGGRGASLYAAAIAYSAFLRELAAWNKPKEELLEMLKSADGLLQKAFDESKGKSQGS